jgi:lipase maturation factor 1
MIEKFFAALIKLLDPEPARGQGGKHEHLLIRWLFLRALGLIYFSAFLPLLYEIRGMLGASGILPIADYLQAVAGAMSGLPRYWYAPTLLWLGASDRALMVLCWVGIAAAVCVVLNLWPRMSLFVCFACFLSFVCVAQEFASFQSDGMLLEAGFIALFFAPAGLRPGLGAASPPIRASLYLLRWEWFRIYFESGVVKIASGDHSWRHLTAMDDYYQNGPLPTWIGWYVQHLPHWFHASAAFMTLFSELVLVWMLFLPRRARIICFCIVTPFQISIILTANYTFLNYIVLLLGILLLDDKAAGAMLPRKFLAWIGYDEAAPYGRSATDAVPVGAAPVSTSPEVPAWRAAIAPFRYLALVICLGMVFYATTAELLWMFLPRLPLPTLPVTALEPSRVANRYGLFAVMTHQRYELEFQGSTDGGKTWTPYPFRFKPQSLDQAPGIYAPYQPRFEWCLWFASLDSWRDNRWVLSTSERLLQNDPQVLELFATNPFAAAAPNQVRTVIYQYWFTDMATKRSTGNWWRRDYLGEYAPTLERSADGRIVMDTSGMPALQ